jgi:2-polyprenyl-3-methyl-5-hydroxy-6-metoxy-1,4-benzoquinol methylase
MWINHRQHFLDMVTNYERQTIKSYNPLAGYAHVNRVNKSIQIAKNIIPPCGSLLDYGCGTGFFLSKMRGTGNYKLVGYESSMEEIVDDNNFVIVKNIDLIGRLDWKFDLITLFEAIEHLNDHELFQFLDYCKTHLNANGCILISAPIEIGPSLILKELNRSLFKFKMSEYGLLELIKASVLGISGKRAYNIKISHKGFDFRNAFRIVSNYGFTLYSQSYGPIPFGTWYGNSQVYGIFKIAF